MSLSAGTRLGPYEIHSLIGAGGMGEVYKARDTRLGRTVAIKVLPHEVASDPERRRRFEQEARAASALNHPHICVLHDIGSTSSPQAPGGATVDYLVMEYLDGQTLAERIAARGAMPLAQALEYAIQIADALSRAHRQGIVHRDLKPANIMLTTTGVKLLDFGLARLTQTSEATGASATISATGTVVGTVPYMAPEQVQGRETDARTDLFAFGAVLYEMLTGKRAFQGDSHASLIAVILEHDPPPVSSLQPLTPPVLDRLVRQCLAKSPDDRPDTAHDIANDMRWVRETSGIDAVTGVRGKRGRRVPTVLLVGFVVIAAAAGAAVMWLLRPSPPSPRVTQVNLAVSAADELNDGGMFPGTVRTPGGSRTALTWTPDGRALIFVGRRGGVQQLYKRALDAAEARPVPHTEGAQLPTVSADGQWVAFWVNGAIKKVRLGDGAVMDLVPGITEPPWGLVWGDGGRLFYGSYNGPIWEMPAEGRPFKLTTVGEAEVTHALPWPLPGGRTVLYTVRKRLWTWGDEEIVAQRLDAAGIATGDRKVLIEGATDARYAPTGHLVFLRQGTLSAVPFNPDSLAVLGEEVPVLQMVVQVLTGRNRMDITGAGQFAIATTGTLAWVPGPVVPYDDATLVTVDRQGRVSPLAAPVRSYKSVRLSPDHRRLAVAICDLTERGLWVHDLDRPGTLTPLNRDGEVMWPLWSPDGQHLLFGWLTGGRRSLATQVATGTASPQVLMPGPFFPSSFTPDGRAFAGVRQPRAGQEDIVMVALEDGKARAQGLIETPQNEGWPELSPDGRWLAYVSNASGEFEVYVQPYPGPGRREPVSIGGGLSPAWHPNGHELFFASRDMRQMMAVEFIPGSPPRIGTPRRLFDHAGALGLSGAPVRSYDVAPDGQRFYTFQMQMPQPPLAVTQINLIENWFEELKAKVPTRR